MSNALAIATVTRTLAQIVRTAVQSVVPGSDVLTSRPDAAATAEPRARLFLYQISPNAALRNNDLPTRAANGTLTSRPTAALDLHYLLSFYGNETELEPQRMLGAAVRDLHAQPVLLRQMIQDAIAGGAVSDELEPDRCRRADQVHADGAVARRAVQALVGVLPGAICVVGCLPWARSS